MLRTHLATLRSLDARPSIWLSHSILSPRATLAPSCRPSYAQPATLRPPIGVRYLAKSATERKWPEKKNGKSQGAQDGVSKNPGGQLHKRTVSKPSAEASGSDDALSKQTVLETIANPDTKPEDALSESQRSRKPQRKKVSRSKDQSPIPDPTKQTQAEKSNLPASGLNDAPSRQTVLKTIANPDTKLEDAPSRQIVLETMANPDTNPEDALSEPRRGRKPPRKVSRSKDQSPIPDRTKQTRAKKSELPASGLKDAHVRETVPKTMANLDAKLEDALPKPRRTRKPLRKVSRSKDQSPISDPINQTQAEQSDLPALGMDPSDLVTSQDVVAAILTSLKSLEHRHDDLNKHLAQLTSAKGSDGRPAFDIDATAPLQSDRKYIKAKNKIEARISTLNKTLQVMRNVLASQHIPIDDLRKSQKQATKAEPVFLKKKPTSAIKTTRKPTKAQGPAVSTLAGRLASPSNGNTPAASTAASPQLEAETKEQRAPRPTRGGDSQPPKRLGRRGNRPLKIRYVTANKLKLTPVDIDDMPPVPSLAYGLERALFNPGVYQLQDQRSKVYNFDPYLSKIMPLNEFDFSALQQYVTSSKDSTLRDLASKLGKKYSGSTSSMTSLLSHFHYLISAWRPINTDNLSGHINKEWKSFTRINRAPAATFLHVKDGVYAIDADKEYDTANILSMLGKSMEKLLTLDKEDFERYRHKNSDQISEEERNAAEAYHYTTMGDFLMRSQLDATDKRLPGTGMFDLKTRAVLSIRMDARGFQKGLGYEIRQRYGDFESFEREYYDMIRSAFLKYSLQVRMGRMDGIFVAFHNTQRIFGFQYIPLEEMDQSIHGAGSRSLGDHEFKLSLHLLNKALDRATARFPGRPLRLHVETRPGNPPFMYIFAKPVNTNEINKVQSASKAAIAEFERKWLGSQSEVAETEDPDPPNDQPQVQDDSITESTEDAKQQTLDFWEEMQDRVEEAVEDDARGISHVRESIQNALEQSGLLQAKSAADARRYVDGLLDALVRSNDYEVENDAIHDSPQATEQPSETATSHVGEDAATTRTDDSFEPDSDLSSVSSPTDDTSETALNGSDVSGTGVADEPSTLGLKDLILRAAEQVDEKPEDANAQATADDAAEFSRLREFERILSELVSTSRKEEQVSSASSDESEEPMSIEFDQSRRTGEDETEAAEGEVPPELDDTLSVEDDELLGMHLTIRNKVNGRYVERAEFDDPAHWALEYSFEEIPSRSAKTIYAALQKRRQTIFSTTGDAELRDKNWRGMFKGQLQTLSQKGRDRRHTEEAKARHKPVHIVGQPEPKTWEDAFSHHQQWVDTTSNKK